jgi:PKD repeat protein
MFKKLIFVSSSLIASLTSYGQESINYTNNVGWLNQTGLLSGYSGCGYSFYGTLDNVGTIGINNSRVEFSNLAGAHINRISKQLNNVYGNNFGYDFEFNIDNANGNSKGIYLASLTSEDLSPAFKQVGVTCPDYSVQNALLLFVESATAASPNTLRLGVLVYQNGLHTNPGALGYITLNGNLTAAYGNTYYARCQVFDNSRAQVSIYSNSARTILVGSSCINLPANFGGLDWIQHGSGTGFGLQRFTTGWLDNSELYPTTPISINIGSIGCGYNFSATGTLPVGVQYLWNFGDGQTSTLANPTHVYANTGSNNVSLTISSNGCVFSTTTSTVLSSVVPTPTISGTTTFCAGASTTLTSSSGTSYLWSNGATSQAITVTTAGTFTVQVSNASGCQSAASAATITTVNVLPATPTISGITTFCAGASTTLTSSSGTSYLWSNGATSQAITVNSPGTYTVQITNAAGCTSLSSTATAVSYATEGCGCIANADPLYIKYLTNTTISVDKVWDSKIYIADNVILTVENAAILDITNSDVVFGKGAGIDFKNGATIRANNSVFRPCAIDQVWRGLKFFKTNQFAPKGNINECTFKNAKTAIECIGAESILNLDLNITNNLFTSCQFGIATNKVKMQKGITGNTYVIDNTVLPYSSTSTVLNASLNNEFNGIRAISSEFTDVIAQNDFLFASNSLLNQAYAIKVSRSSNITVTENKFTDFHTAILSFGNTNVSIEDNEVNWSKLFDFSTNTGQKIQILSASDINVFIKGNTLKNADVMNSNQAVLPAGNYNIGISITNGQKINITQNNLRNFEVGMLFSSRQITTKNVFVTENEINKSWYYGLYIANTENIDVSCNRIDMELNGERDVTGIAYFNTGVGTTAVNTTKIAFRNNCILNTKNGIYLFSSNALAEIPKVYNNFVYNYTKFGFENNGFKALATTSPREIYHNSFVSNNSASGTVDANSDAAHVINFEANFGVQNANTSINMLLANTQASTATCALQVGNFQNNLLAGGIQLCKYFYSGPQWAPIAKMIPVTVEENTSNFEEDVTEVLSPIHTYNKQNIAITDNLFEVFPNPAKDKLNIQYNLDEVTNATIEFLDLQGKVISSSVLEFNFTNIELDITRLPAGVYMVRLINDKKVVNYSKLIKE